MNLKLLLYFNKSLDHDEKIQIATIISEINNINFGNNNLFVTNMGNLNKFSDLSKIKIEEIKSNTGSKIN